MKNIITIAIAILLLFTEITLADCGVIAPRNIESGGVGTSNVDGNSAESQTTARQDAEDAAQEDATDEAARKCGEEIRTACVAQRCEYSSSTYVESSNELNESIVTAKFPSGRGSHTWVRCEVQYIEGRPQTPICSSGEGDQNLDSTNGYARATSGGSCWGSCRENDLPNLGVDVFAF